MGNGLMGAMVFGGVPTERIQFNEGTIWTGQPHAYQHEGAVKFLPEIRRLLQQGRVSETEGLKKQKEASQLQAGGNAAEGKAKQREAQELLKVARTRQKEAEDLAMKEFMSEPIHQKAYQPCADLWIDFPGQTQATDYRRWLDLDTAVCATEYKRGEVTYRRELFASYPDHAIVTRLSADAPGRLDCRLWLSSTHQDAQATVQGRDTLVVRGQVEAEGVRFESQAQIVIEGGQLVVETNTLRVTGASAVVIRLVAASNFKNYRDLSANPTARCTEFLKNAAGKTYEQLRQAHLNDHQTLFRRVKLELGRTDAAGKPTDQRIAGFAQGNDPHLAALLFQYGRYLLIGSNRPGGQPATNY